MLVQGFVLQSFILINLFVVAVFASLPGVFIVLIIIVNNDSIFLVVQVFYVCDKCSL